MTDAQHASPPTCFTCDGLIEFIEYAPHAEDDVLDSWWAHVVHPADGHDAVPVPPEVLAIRENLNRSLDALNASLEPKRWDLFSRWVESQSERESMRARSDGKAIRLAQFNHIVRMLAMVACAMVVSWRAEDMAATVAVVVLLSLGVASPMLDRSRAYYAGWRHSRNRAVERINETRDANEAKHLLLLDQMTEHP